MPSLLDTHISSCDSWNEFVVLANTQASTKAKGDLFERLTQVFLMVTPEYQAKLANVWSVTGDELPERVRTKLKLPKNDEGIDLVCETNEGAYWSVQCKYKSDQSRALTHKELSTFTSLSFNTAEGIDLGLVFHTSTRKVKKSSLLANVTEVGLEKWLSITEENWGRIRAYCHTNKLSPPKKRKPMPHQQEAVGDAVQHFNQKRHPRGKLIMPCGTGKSLTAFWIAKALKAKSVIVAVPSLALVKQSLGDWTEEYLAEGIQPEWLAVCSDESVGSTKDADSTVATVYEMGIPTNPTDEELDLFLKRKTSNPKVIFTTYQSAEKLCTAAKRCKKKFDLLIADEAHKTAGRKSKTFASLLFDENIRIGKRLFMTATERVYNGSKDAVVSMDDESIYGTVFHALTFKKAIEQEIICDYKIVTIGLSNDQLKNSIEEKVLLDVFGVGFEKELDAHTLAAGVALKKAFHKYNIRHAISFHSSIKRAENFRVLQDNIQLSSDTENSHISSKLSAGERAKLLKAFAEAKKSLVTNARCLTEGVDIKSIDCVAFVDPKQSTVDIVQAAGRAMRHSKATGKKFGYIVLPILVETGMTVEGLENSNQFKAIAKVVTALSTQDERIAEELKLASEKQASKDRRVIEFDDTFSELISVQLEELVDNLKLKLWEKVGKANWLPFEDARKYSQSLGLKTNADWSEHTKSTSFPIDIPKAPWARYKNAGWNGMSDWLGNNQLRANEEYWPYAKARDFVHKLGLKNSQEWRDYSKSSDRPRFVPASPANVYEKTGWTGIADWIGVTNVAKGYKKFLPFNEARKIVQELGLSSSREWREYIKEENFPANLPKAPENAYANDGWSGYGDWLGTGTIAPGSQTYRSFSEARKFARKLGLASYTEWAEFTKSGNLPEDIPVAVARTYEDEGWQGFSDFLGTTNKHRDEYSWRPFEKAKKFARSLNLQSEMEWRKFAKSDKRPEDIPYAPDSVYNSQGWAGYQDFLGFEVDRKTKWRPFKEARAYVRDLKLKGFRGWREYASSGKRPKDIPSAPEDAYKDQGWAGHSDWTGYKQR